MINNLIFVLKINLINKNMLNMPSFKILYLLRHHFLQCMQVFKILVDEVKQKVIYDDSQFSQKHHSTNITLTHRRVSITLNTFFHQSR